MFQCIVKRKIKNKVIVNYNLKNQMKLPRRPAYLSTTYNFSSSQHEVIIEHIIPTAKLKIIDNNSLNKEKYQSIQFCIIDKSGKEFNTDNLANLFSNETGESEEFRCELHPKDHCAAIPPLKFILKSEDLDLSKMNFKISWEN